MPARNDIETQPTGSQRIEIATRSRNTTRAKPGFPAPPPDAMAVPPGPLDKKRDIRPPLRPAGAGEEGFPPRNPVPPRPPAPSHPIFPTPMPQYLFLRHPGHNRVYHDASERVALAELTLAARQMSCGAAEPRPETIAGVSYLRLGTQSEPAAADLALIARMSFLLAAFRDQGDEGQPLLAPLRVDAPAYIDPRVGAGLRYPGKTNETFTKAMIDLGLLASGMAPGQRGRLLDPVAGRCTTLFEAAVYGLDAFGMECEAKPADEAAAYFRRFLQNARLKHLADRRQVAGRSSKGGVYMQEFRYSADKEEFKDESQRRTLGIVTGSALDAASCFRRGAFDLLVGDLPYGGAYGGSVNASERAEIRNPADLLRHCLPGWHAVLRPGGAAVVAWNTYVVTRRRMADEFARAGFEVLDGAPYDTLEHQVDASIRRDVMVALKR